MGTSAGVSDGEFRTDARGAAEESGTEVWRPAAAATTATAAAYAAASTTLCLLRNSSHAGQQETTTTATTVPPKPSDFLSRLPAHRSSCCCRKCGRFKPVSASCCFLLLRRSRDNIDR